METNKIIRGPIFLIPGLPHIISVVLSVFLIGCAVAELESAEESLSERQPLRRVPSVVRLRDMVNPGEAWFIIQSNQYVLLMNCTDVKDGKLRLLLDKETALQLGVTGKVYDDYVKEIKKQ